MKSVTCVNVSIKLYLNTATVKWKRGYHGFSNRFMTVDPTLGRLRDSRHYSWMGFMTVDTTPG